MQKFIDTMRKYWVMIITIITYIVLAIGWFALASGRMFDDEAQKTRVIDHVLEYNQGDFVTKEEYREDIRELKEDIKFIREWILSQKND